MRSTINLFKVDGIKLFIVTCTWRKKSNVNMKRIFTMKITFEPLFVKEKKNQFYFMMKNHNVIIFQGFRVFKSIPVRNLMQSYLWYKYSTLFLNTYKIAYTLSLKTVCWNFVFVIVYAWITIDLYKKVKFSHHFSSTK